jgi:hypothetical protein
MIISIGAERLQQNLTLFHDKSYDETRTRRIALQNDKDYI